jgi:penicillin-binding protein 1A
MQTKKHSSKLVKRLWIFFASGVGVFFLIVLFASLGWLGKLPDINELENPTTKLASEIYAEDGVLLGKIYSQEDRTNISYNELPQHMVEALVATEDARFYRHSGIDVKSLFRAVVFLGKRGGGSTLTQQLAKNMFHPARRNFAERVLQKLKEWIIAVELEKRYTKDEILLMYFNTVPWENSYGIKSAAKKFFNKDTKKLTIEEGAMLVGLLKASGYYHPVHHPDRALRRRNTVFNQMEKYGYIEKLTCDSLKNTQIDLDYQVITHNRGMATYFREYLRKYLEAWCEKKGVNMYNDGLKIYTTLNSKVQQYAEEAVSEHMSSLQAQFYDETKRLKSEPWRSEKEGEYWKTDPDFILKHTKRTERYQLLKRAYNGNEDSINFYLNQKIKMNVFSYRGDIDTVMSPIDSMKYAKQILHTGFMSMDPHTGHIKAWVGGINLKHFQYDHVNKGSSRQVGSTFKPIVYARALDDDKIEPCEMVPTGPVTLELEDGNTWTPSNSGKVSAPEVSLYTGLKMSYNTVTARVMKRLGPQSPYAVKEISDKLGIDTKKFMPYPSICLGTMDISVFEMVGAYSAFANQGEWVEPIFITRIEDKNGNVLEDFIPKHVEAMRSQTAYIMLKMLEKVVESGTGARLRGRYGITAPIAGKTGTTQNNSDGWFMAITPDLVSGCWVGAEDRQVRFRSTNLGQGANMALPIPGIFLRKLQNDPKIKMNKDPFKKPDQEMTVELNCDLAEPIGSGGEYIEGIDF